jgi:DHA1 family multidrug resistance protein-like MFS transporter
VSNTVSILGMSIYLFGIAFAPIHTPHLSERHGRSLVYLVTIFIYMLFVLGATRSQNIASLLVCRFFAGLFGGPSLVLIEGTFA